MSMTKKELIQNIAEETDESQATVTRVVEALFGTITDQLVSDHDLAVPGFGKFTTTVRAARIGRNPATGESIEIPETRTPAFNLGN